MHENFQRVWERIKSHEGGYVNHPRDPGGATNLGVTQRTFDSFLAASGKSPVSVRNITEAQARAIFNVRYWIKVSGDNLRSGWDYAVADFYYNSGSHAIRTVQEVLGLEADGKLGPVTIAAINKAPKEKLAAYADARLAFLKTLGTWPTFGKGWAARVAHVKATSLKDWA